MTSLHSKTDELKNSIITSAILLSVAFPAVLHVYWSVCSTGKRGNVTYQQQALVDVDGYHPDGEVMTGAVFDIQRHVVVVV